MFWNTISNYFQKCSACAPYWLLPILAFIRITLDRKKKELMHVVYYFMDIYSWISWVVLLNKSYKLSRSYFWINIKLTWYIFGLKIIKSLLSICVEIWNQDFKTLRTTATKLLFWRVHLSLLPGTFMTPW